jgi:hypothetical protein
MCGAGWCGCWVFTVARTPVTSTGRCSSSSSGWRRRKISPTRWRGCIRQWSPRSWCRSLPAKNYRSWGRRVRAAASLSGVTPRSLPCLPRPASARPSWPGSAMTRTTRRPATWTCGSGRSPSVGRAARYGLSRSPTMPRALDRYIRVRARHAQAWRRLLWLGVNNRGPLMSNGIYQMVARRGRECGVVVHPHRFRHHFSHTWLDRGGAEADLMELNGWSSPADAASLRRQCP